MSAPILFLSAATLDLKAWRDHLHDAFSRAGFRLLTQDHSLRSAPGDVRRLLAETIEEADCVIHLAGLAYGSHATDPFPAASSFQCSWTQFEYYHAHEQGKDVIAFVCAPDLSSAFTEKGPDAAQKTALQQAHRDRVQSGQFTGTPLEGKVDRTSNETVANPGHLLSAVAAAVGTLHRLDREHRTRAQQELRTVADTLARVEQRQKNMHRLLGAAAALILLVSLGTYALMHTTRRTEASTVAIKADTTQLSSQLSQVQEALSKLQQNTDLKTDPLSAWPQERLETELARAMSMEIAALRAILTAGKTSLDALLQGQALLASGQRDAAGEKFDTVITQEQSALERLRKAYEGKAQIAYAQVKYEESLAYRQKAAALIEKQADPLAWATAQLRVAYVLDELARYEESEPLEREVLRLREQHLPPNHPDVSLALNNLALLLHAINRFTEAEPMFRRALKIDEATFGPDHPNVAMRLNNLALLLHATNRFTEAEQLIHRALKIDEVTFGPDHPNVAIHLNNLAELLRDTSRLTEAEPLIHRALKIYEATFGPNHPDVSLTLNNLALLLHATKRFTEAEPMFRRALKIDEATFGPDHPNVAIKVNNLAQLLHATNRFTDAEPMLRRALKIDEATFGPDHPKVAKRLNNLASVLEDTKRQDEAEPMFRRALKIYEATFGPDHPDVSLTLNKLALLLHDANRFTEAEPMFRRAFKIDEATFGPDHPKVAKDLNGLAQLLKATHRLAEAEPLLQRCVTILENKGGEPFPNYAGALNNLAQLFKATDRLEEAEPLMRRALEIGETSLGPDHPNVAIRLNNLAQLLTYTNRPAEAAPLMRRAAGIFMLFQIRTGYPHPQSEAPKKNYRLLLSQMGQSEAQIAEAFRALEEEVSAQR